MITGDYLKTATAIARCGPVVRAGVQAEVIEASSLLFFHSATSIYIYIYTHIYIYIYIYIYIHIE